MTDQTTLAISIAAILISIAAIIPSYYNLLTRRAEKRRIDFEVERIKYDSTSPIDSEWTIRILRPSKTIEHCSVTIQYPTIGTKDGRFDTKARGQVKLPVADRQNMYEIKISKEGSAESSMNFRVPKGIVPEGSVVLVKDGGNVLLRRKTEDIPLVNP